MPGRPCSVAIRRAALNRLSLIQGGFDIGDGFEQIVGILLQLCECPYRLFRIDAQSSMIEKMGLPDDCGAALVGCDQEREDRGGERHICVSLRHEPSSALTARIGAPSVLQLSEGSRPPGVGRWE